MKFNNLNQFNAGLTFSTLLCFFILPACGGVTKKPAEAPTETKASPSVEPETPKPVKPSRESLVNGITDAETKLKTQGFVFKTSVEYFDPYTLISHDQPKVVVSMVELDKKLLAAEVNTASQRNAFKEFVEAVNNLREHYKLDETSQDDLAIDLKNLHCSEQLNKIYNNLLIDQITHLKAVNSKYKLLSNSNPDSTYFDSSIRPIWNLSFLEYIKTDSTFSLATLKNQLQEIATLTNQIKAEANSIKIRYDIERNLDIKRAMEMAESISKHDSSLSTLEFVEKCLNDNELYVKPNFDKIIAALLKRGIKFLDNEPTKIDEGFYKEWRISTAFQDKEEHKSQARSDLKTYKEWLIVILYNESLRLERDTSKTKKLVEEFNSRVDAMLELFKKY